MSNNFSGVEKGGRTFRPKGSGGGDAGVGKAVAGLWPGLDPVVVFEKADSPTLDTTPTPRTDGRGESEIDLGGQVDHPDTRCSGSARGPRSCTAWTSRQRLKPVGRTADPFQWSRPPPYRT